MEADNSAPLLLIEAFYTGSHKQLLDLLHECVGNNVFVVTCPGKKWHWKARTSALTISQQIPVDHKFKRLWASSVLSLAELVALRPDLAALHKIIYMHENQLAYPVKTPRGQRDYQYGYNQILTCMVADQVLFNSEFCLSSFVEAVPRFLSRIPDASPDGKKCRDVICSKATVLYFPINLQIFSRSNQKNSEEPCKKQEVSEINLTNDIALCLHFSKKSKADDTIRCTASNFADCETHNVMGDEHLMDSKVGSGNASPGTGPMEGTKISKCCEASDSPEQVTHFTSCDSGSDRKPEVLSWSCESVSGRPLLSPEETFYKLERDRDSSLNPTSSDTCDVENHVSHDVEKQTRHLCNSRVPRPLSSVRPLHIVWPHRWEHDKQPELFFRCIMELHEQQQDFTLSVLGEKTADVPEVFDRCHAALAPHLMGWGYAPRSEYLRLLRDADVVVSTSLHEFYGVAMLEAVSLGCYPLCPNRLVYPEIYPAEYLYNTERQLLKRLKRFCVRPQLVRDHVLQFDVNCFHWSQLKHDWRRLLLQ